MIKNCCRSLILIVFSFFSLLVHAQLSLKSPAFNNNTAIPKFYTCEGSNVSPPLFWQNTPKNTQSFVLIMDDIDAPSGDWIHWIVYNIPANIKTLSEGAAIPAAAQSGLNSWRQSGYRGPCPPGGKHHYFFRLFALDRVLKLSSSSTKQALLKAMQGHVLETSELIGIYGKE